MSARRLDISLLRCEKWSMFVTQKGSDSKNSLKTMDLSVVGMRVGIRINL